ncbi:hypothetical protein COU74_00285 [Candidatus Peregrinibacteria bacterium CG10_big_fil_rev_8_21_14_0_10_36_19]|nr:MAG: hypothetical protein COU74_00285 [Candidatus Peregrinibacteria bacterium CG10_big_fil_rev_8_21_14_0_10_36_19]
MQMKVLLLAAGRSKRMKPVEDKNFLKFLGKPLIVWQLEMLKEVGLLDVVVVGGDHNLERLKDATDHLEMNIEYVEQENLDEGMCGAVLAAKEYILEQSVLVFSSNDVVEASAFETLKRAFEPGDMDSYILGKKVESYFPGGYLETNEDGVISRIVEKPGEGNEPSDLVNLVVHLHKHTGDLIEALENVESDNDDKYEVALSNMIAGGSKMKAVAYEGFWQPIKFPWHIQKVARFLINESEKFIASSAQIAATAVIHGKVIIDEDVKIMDGAIVSGPCYLGKGSVVANNALVRDSNVGERCVVGFGTEVARSYLGDDVWTHSNYIGDSVIGNNVSFGAGCVTGNLRLDEGEVMVDFDGKKLSSQSNKFGLITGSNIRVGVNTSFMPGVKIGDDCFIGAGIVVAENVPDKSFVRAKVELKISENNQSAPRRDNFK